MHGWQSHAWASRDAGAHGLAARDAGPHGFAAHDPGPRGFAAHPVGLRGGANFAPGRPAAVREAGAPFRAPAGGGGRPVARSEGERRER
jgi:hypothetical protein